MSVSLDWLTEVDVTISTTVVQVPSFNNAMIMGVFPSASKPVSWGSAIYKLYTSSATVASDFAAALAAAILATQWAQVFKYQILIKAASDFFAQTPTPTSLYIGMIDNTATVNYVTQINLICAAFNNFYSFYIADQITTAQVLGTSPTPSGGGIYAAVNGLASSNNLKVCFLDTSDLDIVATNFLYDVTALGIGAQRVMLFAHTDNPQSAVPSAAVAAPTICLGAATMGAFFTNLFTSTVGLKSVSGQTLSGSLPSDSAVTSSTIGTPGAGDGLLGVNANVFPSFGTSATGYIQYGFMASSTTSALLYLDQVVGADYIKLNVQADLVTYLLGQQSVGGVPYSDVGIQNLVSVFKKTLQGAVTQNIIQQFANTNVTAVSYANTPSADKTNRIYQGLAASLTYLGRIQRLKVGITLGL